MQILQKMIWIYKKRTIKPSTYLVDGFIILEGKTTGYASGREKALARKKETPSDKIE